jgi:hypothetical protein
MRYQVSIALGKKIRSAEAKSAAVPDHLLRAYAEKLSPNRMREAYFNASPSKFMLCQTEIKDNDIEAWASSSPSSSDENSTSSGHDEDAYS